MVESDGVTTLIGRTETHGRPYPDILEKMILLTLIVVAVIAGKWMWMESDWSTFVLWPAIICGLPLGTLILTEMLSRIIQGIHASSE